MTKKDRTVLIEKGVYLFGFIFLLALLVAFVFFFVLGCIRNKDSNRSFISNEQTVECKNVLFINKCKITYVPSDPWKHDLCYNQRYFFKKPTSEFTIVYTDRNNPTKCNTKSSELRLDNILEEDIALMIIGSLFVIFPLLTLIWSYINEKKRGRI